MSPAVKRTLSTWHRCVIFTALAVSAYFQTWIELIPHWTEKNATYTHGWLIAATSCWLVWQRKRDLSLLPATATIAAIPIVLGLSFVWLIASSANIFIAHVALWPILALSIIWAGAGRKAATLMAFPLALLYFAIPIWELLKAPLQIVASAVVGSITGALGVSAAVDGPYIILPNQTIYIALDCSGAHFLAVALAVGVLAGELRKDNIKTRMLIVCIAGILSMIFNWLRITLIVYAYYHDNLRTTLETMGHLTFGWWVFGLDLIVFAVVLRFVPPSEPPIRSLPTQRMSPRQARGNNSEIIIVALAALALPTLAWVLSQFAQYPDASERPNLELGNQFAELSPYFLWTPAFEGTAWEYRTAIMTQSGSQIEIYANRYHQQKEGSELISKGSKLFDSLNFHATSSRTTTIPFATDRDISAIETRISDNAGYEWIALYTYVVDSKSISSKWQTQLTTALLSLYRKPQAGIVAVTTRCNNSCEATKESLQEPFLSILDAYVAAIPGVH